MSLNATQEHYLKRELLKFQLRKEFADLNNGDALRRFGYPFTVHDPKSVKRKRHIKGITHDPDDDIETQFPMCSYILREFVMTFPLLSRNIAVDEIFWQYKVQVFFEHFMSLGFSDSYDREKSTKRKKIATKLTKIILLLFNSGVGSAQEISYYEHDKFTLKNDDKVRKRSKIEEFAMPTTETLKQLVTSEPMYINEWDINIVACVKDYSIEDTRKWNKSESVMVPSAVTPQSFTTGTIKSITSTSRWMKNTITSTPSSLFSKLSISGSSSTASVVSDPQPFTKKNKNWFILKVKNKKDPNKIIYTAKSYDDFKTLAHNLRLESPGKKFPKVPHKTKKGLSLVTKSELLPNGRVPVTPQEKIISSYETDNDSANSTMVNDTQEALKNLMENEKVKDEVDEDEENEDEDDVTNYEEFEDAVDTKTNRLKHERMRTSLRQYLRNLSTDLDTSTNITFVNFLTAENIVDFNKFKPDILEDIKNRELVDIANLKNQLLFQKLALEKSLALQDAMKDFKTSLLRDEKYLLSLVNELKIHTKISQLSPLLQNFIEWFKIYFASMIYQLFLGNDNSYGFYTQVRRLHKLMPYMMMGQIMRFTNPMSIMKGMIDLFMAQPFGGHSLLQTMFSTILTDDLRSQTHVIKKLEDITIKESPTWAPIVIECLKKIIDDNNKEEFDMDSIHRESETMDMPFCLILLMKCVDLKKINNDAVNEVIESYSSWKLKEPEGFYFQHIKELLQLYIKERDKRLMRKLWQDPELSKLLKAIVTIIYEPMVKIFKIARMDIALRNFERFMNDLIKLMDDVIDGQIGVSTQFNIIERIIDLVTKHQDSFFEFVHDVYNNDTEGIFEGFIGWISNIITFLQRSKFGTDMTERIDFNELLINSNEDIKIDMAELKKEVDEVINKKMEARKVYREIVKSKVDDSAVTSSLKKGKGGSNAKTSNKFMDDRWNYVSSIVMPDSTTSFGLQDGELVDLDLDTKDFDYLERDDNAKLEKKYQAVLSQAVDESTIEQLVPDWFELVLKRHLAPVSAPVKDAKAATAVDSK